MEPVKQASFERTYDAPLQTVWEAWTDPAQLKQWWGPDNVSIPECEVDLRVGGRFYIVMEAGPAMGDYAGTRWPMDATYTSIEPQAELAYDAKAWTEGDEADTTIVQTTILNLKDDGGKTIVNITATIHSTGPKAGAAVEGMTYGFNQQLDKFETFLRQL